MTDTTTHAPCCSSHNASLDCDTFRRTHVVAAGSDCCDTWTEANPYGGWVPRGCPAGFSSECSSWSSADPCRCLVATLSPAADNHTVPTVPAGE